MPNATIRGRSNTTQRQATRSRRRRLLRRSKRLASAVGRRRSSPVHQASGKRTSSSARRHLHAGSSAPEAFPFTLHGFHGVGVNRSAMLPSTPRHQRQRFKVGYGHSPAATRQRLHASASPISTRPCFFPSGPSTKGRCRKATATPTSVSDRSTPGDPTGGDAFALSEIETATRARLSKSKARLSAISGSFLIFNSGSRHCGGWCRRTRVAGCARKCAQRLSVVGQIPPNAIEDHRQIAQQNVRVSAEKRTADATENHGVGGSIPPLGTNFT